MGGLALEYCVGFFGMGGPDIERMSADFACHFSLRAVLRTGEGPRPLRAGATEPGRPALRDTLGMPPPTPAPHRKKLRVLHLEDSELDHDLAMAHLRRSGLEVETVRVDSEPAFRAALE